jgi:hypothetical protein
MSARRLWLGIAIAVWLGIAPIAVWGDPFGSQYTAEVENLPGTDSAVLAFDGVEEAVGVAGVRIGEQVTPLGGGDLVEFSIRTADGEPFVGQQVDSFAPSVARIRDLVWLPEEEAGVILPDTVYFFLTIDGVPEPLSDALGIFALVEFQPQFGIHPLDPALPVYFSPNLVESTALVEFDTAPLLGDTMSLGPALAAFVGLDRAALVDGIHIGFVVVHDAPVADSDGDGVPDDEDGCPTDPGKIAPGECGCGTPDDDGDGDGTADCDDGCPADPEKSEAGVCGCGTPDDDADGDGTADCDDGCPADPDKSEAGVCGCGTPDDDGDGDGTADCDDGCPADPEKSEAGVCGCGTPDDDADGDGIADCDDGCPADPDKSEAGVCGCGSSDADSDGDGIPDCNDACPNSDPDATVVVGECDSGVDNAVLSAGCLISDEVANCATGVATHGKFVRCVDRLVQGLKKKAVGILTNQEADAIKTCAAHSDIP